MAANYSIPKWSEEKPKTDFHIDGSHMPNRLHVKDWEFSSDPRYDEGLDNSTYVDDFSK